MGRDIVLRANNQLQREDAGAGASAGPAPVGYHFEVIPPEETVPDRHGIESRPKHAGRLRKRDSRTRSAHTTDGHPSFCYGVMLFTRERGTLLKLRMH